MTAKAVGWVALMLLCSMATGTEWVKRYDGGNGDDGAAAMALSAGGYLYITGYQAGSDSTADMAVIRLDTASGTLQNSASYRFKTGEYFEDGAAGNCPPSS